MKAIIPVAGAGTKLRPLTYTQPKPLIPIAGKPIISHILDSLIENGIREFVFVVGYMGEKIKNYVNTNYPEIEKNYAFQAKRQGLGHAVWTAREFLEDTDEVVIVLGDTIVDLDLKSFLSSKDTILGVRKVVDPRQFGVVELDEEGMIKKLVEKPTIPKSNLAIAGIYKITDVTGLLDALEYNIEKEVITHGEYQLTDGLSSLLKKGAQMKVMEVDSWYDCGQKDILLETNAKKLEGLDQAFAKNFPDAILIPPVSIGEGAEIEHSIIGPNVSIGQNTVVKNSIISDSIVGSFCRLQGVSLEKSIIGQDVTINGMNQSLNIGDNTEIDFST